MKYVSYISAAIPYISVAIAYISAAIMVFLSFLPYSFVQQAVLDFMPFMSFAHALQFFLYDNEGYFFIFFIVAIFFLPVIAIFLGAVLIIWAHKEAK